MPCGFLYADFYVRIFVCGFIVRIFREDFSVRIFVWILDFLRADFSADFDAFFFEDFLAGRPDHRESDKQKSFK